MTKGGALLNLIVLFVGFVMATDCARNINRPLFYLLPDVSIPYDVYFFLRHVTVYCSFTKL